LVKIFARNTKGELMRVVLTIAGSDSSGGAGIQADLKTFEAFGVFGTSALTVLTAQNTTGVRDIHEIHSDFIKAQIEAVLEDFDVRAIKIGMLYSNAIIDTIREIIKGLNIPIVLDTVFISKAGSKLLHDDAIENMKTLFPYATLITEFGTGDPKLLAGGISIALVTTELGLIVAIPALLFGNLLTGWATSIKDKMEQGALHVVNTYEANKEKCK
jgi:hypothetical protein